MIDGKGWPGKARELLRRGQLRLRAKTVAAAYYPTGVSWHALVGTVVDLLDEELLPAVDWHHRLFAHDSSEHHVGLRLPGALEVRLRLCRIGPRWFRVNWREGSYPMPGDGPLWAVVRGGGCGAWTFHDRLDEAVASAVILHDHAILARADDVASPIASGPGDDT